MKLFIVVMGLMAQGVIAIDTLQSNQLLDEPLLSVAQSPEAVNFDALIKRIGIKDLLGDAIKKIEYLKMDHANFEKILDVVQQELQHIKQAMNTMVIPDNECIKILRREVKILKWALAINFGLIVTCQAYFYYDQF